MQGLPGMNKLVNVYRTPFVLTGITGVSKAIAPLARRSQTVAVNSVGVGLDSSTSSPLQRFKTSTLTERAPRWNSSLLKTRFMVR